MKDSPRFSTTQRGTEIDRRLESYSSLGVVALATTAVACATTAQGQTQVHLITATPTLQADRNVGTLGFTMAGAGFFLAGDQFDTSRGYKGQVAITEGVLGGLFDPRVGHALAPGGVISHGVPHTSFPGEAGIFATQGAQKGIPSDTSIDLLHPSGPNAAATGLVGFAVRNGNYYYGWVRVRVTTDADGRPATISLVSDGTASGAWAQDRIIAGQESAIPEPASVAGGLGLLALGAAGVCEMRRRRSVRPVAAPAAAN